MQGRLPKIAFYFAFLSLLITACAGLVPASIESIAGDEEGSENPSLGEDIAEIALATPTPTLDEL